eukprot:NODE_5649_length_280_cov_3.991342_g5566_i0.p2 GENE.NODE_5649_length_280_cov_3.991342_g5566_i0~~NODE_5649_length_280_cov_3.991342_g5566_i0.p2  ORF type:complete len:51 (+),score=3.83 NODE_5649_length_280_cov_3.991342_g5566_i0:68-220(+)
MHVHTTKREFTKEKTSYKSKRPREFKSPEIQFRVCGCIAFAKKTHTCTIV